MSERLSHHDPGFEGPSPLLPEVAEALRKPQYAAVLAETNYGTTLIVKAPRRDIRSARGRIPIQLTHELYSHPAAPVVRMVTRIYDVPEQPLTLETFINVEDAVQRADYSGLAEQEALVMLFYDEQLDHRLTKRVGNLDSKTVTEILTKSAEMRAAISPERRDFERARAAVMARTKL